jgi:hypothetical protein
MKHFIYLAALSLLVALGPACSLKEPANVPTEGTGEPLWVAKTYTVGRACTSDKVIVPPPHEELASYSIIALRTELVGLPTCEACYCPKYNGVHYAEIRTSHRARAQSAGFMPTDSPPLLTEP